MLRGAVSELNQPRGDLWIFRELRLDNAQIPVVGTQAFLNRDLDRFERWGAAVVVAHALEERVQVGAW